MSSDDPISERKSIVLGEQLAAAHEVERSRIAQRGSESVDVALPSYDRLRGEYDLLRFAPCDVDDPLRSFCREFAALSAEVREARRNSISMDGLYALLTFARRSAVYAIGASDRKRWFDGLLAIAAVDIDRVDYRDLLNAANILDCVSIRAGISDAERIEDLEAAAAVAHPQVAESLRRRAAKERPDASSLRGACGLWTLRTEYGAGLVQCGFEAYRPKRNLLRIGLQIGRLLETDQYVAHSFSVADALPRFWLGETDAGERDAVLSRLRGVSTLSGDLRTEATLGHDDQMLFAMIAEAEDEADVETLLRLARLPTKDARLGVAHENLFVLIVARSGRVGVANHETTRSLSRFEADLSRILETACRQ